MPRRLTALEELRAAIRTTARECDPKQTSSEAASQFYADNRELIASVADQWIIEKLAALIGKQRAKARRENNPQLVLEGMLGFTHLPATIEVEPGTRVRREEATIQVFRKLVRNLKNRSTPAVEEAERAIALMSKYTPQNRRITWKQVLEKEAAV